METAPLKLKCEIVTPEGLVFDEPVAMVVVPGTAGEMGLLPRHAPLVSSTVVGEARVRLDDEEQWQRFAVGNGYVKMQYDRLLLLVEAAEPATGIDTARAKAALARAQELLSREGEAAVDVSRAEQARQRAANRLKVAGRL